MGLFVLSKENTTAGYIRAALNNLKLHNKTFKDSGSHLIDAFAIPYLEKALVKLEEESLYKKECNLVE